jgi:hypothetical protein
LTSGNVDYADRAHFYELVEDSLLPGGLLFDKVLTNEKPLLTLAEIASAYAWIPLNIQSVNYFSCEALFCSELIAERGIVDSSAFYDRLSSVLLTRRLQKVIEAAQLITPRDCIWYYGRIWAELKSSYCPRLRTIDVTSMPDDGPYTGRVQHRVMTKV